MQTNSVFESLCRSINAVTTSKVFTSLKKGPSSRLQALFTVPPAPGIQDEKEGNGLNIFVETFAK